MVLANATVEAFVSTTDADRARKFYEGTLGLPLVEDNGFALLFAGANARVRVTRAPEVVAAGYTVLGWVVQDIEATVDDLGPRGVAFEDYAGIDQDERLIWSAPGGARIAWFKDPDGNTLSIAEFPSGLD